ncbi:CDP-alcohol phosphatidyltransferase family protein [Anaeromyxobacter diazotrophicus]|uniref:CDP-diacylglycerol--glycerol-3-phosphate 3-phosphatidyltransferase n=1 Tax=Anaeromyxobacter diazotrophicus TaxID=2590199 RepID=A0A7I9VPA9_9BACT|nr:CDP-alcohol phosphatidyltransferase family protein [Anaeromyxobacter diazotrophicus]GEJ58256.1 CDP-alcohol phosphatidyltransferase [Anaeromyxobacter diazotrophicus]
MPRRLTLPNALTASRIVLAPVFLVLYARGDTVRALAAFAAAAATDVLDGLAARVLRQHSRLGAFLDPIADKFLAACALFALWQRGRLPLWLPLLVISRDAAQLAGAAALRWLRREIPVAPTRIGKYATFGIAATVVLSLAAEFLAWPPRQVAPVVAALGLVAAECVTVSWFQYFLYFVRSARVPADTP